MIKGKTAFVTGGTGAVGAAIVRCLATHGAQVAFSYHNAAAKAAQLEQELNPQGRRTKAYPLDQSDSGAVAKLVEAIERDLGPVDILVNNDS